MSALVTTEQQPMGRAFPSGEHPLDLGWRLFTDDAAALPSHRLLIHMPAETNKFNSLTET